MNNTISFLAFYEETATPLNLSPDSTIMELKDTLSAALGVEFNNMKIYLINYGQIDNEDMICLPLEVLELSKNVSYNLIISDETKEDQLAKKICTKKLVGFNPIYQVGFEFKSRPICLACSIFCRKGNYDFTNPISNQEFICQCSSADGHCNFAQMDFNQAQDSRMKYIKGILEEHAELKLQFEQKKAEEKREEILKRKFNFDSSIKFGLQRVQSYNDELLIAKILSLIPHKGENTSQHDYVKELLKWFKEKFFTWCDKPKCQSCGENKENMQYVETSQPTGEESKFLASRAEVYKCTKCHIDTRFARYNNPIKLLETRTGRCGEWANLFGAIINAVGYKVRFVDNFEDHVWNEFYSEEEKRWIHVDSCENAFDKPLLYEQGWGRVMTFVMAYSASQATEVTPRYIKNWHVCQSRRNPSEEKRLENLIASTNVLLQEKLDPKECEELARMNEEENKFFKDKKEDKIKVEVSQDEMNERESGSVEWRKERGEKK